MTLRTTFQIASALCVAHSTVAAECLPYEPASSTIAGTITRGAFPGRPNFTSIADGDEKLVYWILTLDSPACVGSTTLATEVNEVESGVSEIQLVPRDDRFYEQYQGVIGKHVKATGTLFHQHSAWHMTRVVLQVDSLSIDQSNTQQEATRHP